MPEILEKLRPDRDLQCYFLRPSAIAALSNASPTGFALSGSWRQQFDWAVVEWNRDNVFEHPSFRNLPDGDLSGLTLTYEETRTNCISVDSSLFPTVDWPSLRIWAKDASGNENVYFVPLQDHATPIEGDFQQASADLTISGTVTDGDLVGFSFLDEHYAYYMRDNDTAHDILENALVAIVDAVNGSSKTLTAVRNGRTIRFTLKSPTQEPGDPRFVNRNYLNGANGNRVGLYTYVQGSTEQWDATSKQFSGGTSPTKWRMSLAFSALIGSVTLPGGALVAVPVDKVRKVRWTYAADLQASAFIRSEFQVALSNWTVTGNGRTYSVAGPGTRRINDDDASLSYSSGWQVVPGASDLPLDHYDGGTVHFTSLVGANVRCNYSAAQSHVLYLGTRRTTGSPQIGISVDGQPAITLNLNVPLEDILVREKLGSLEPGNHTIVATLSTPGTFCFDFLELAVPTTTLPQNDIENRMTLATDWDTDHSIALAPERTAWIMDSLGFKGRPNHYVGALWFYELVRPAQVYASGKIAFAGVVETSNGITEVAVGRTDDPTHALTRISHLNLIGDTNQTLAKHFELQINAGSNAIWAKATGAELAIYSRSMGADGNTIIIAVSPAQNSVTGRTSPDGSGTTLTGGIDGDWLTDLQATPRLNRAVRDWTGSFFSALKSYGHQTVAGAFSTELQHGDPSVAAGIAQRYPSGKAVIVNTPALQTNFSPESIAFWRQVYVDMATLQKTAGLRPYIQFGEVQWWYFADDRDPMGNRIPGMPFYDAYTLSLFKAQYGRDMKLIQSNDENPRTVPEEAAFLPTLLGNYTSQIMAFVSGLFPDCQFEVLYPTDVNDFALSKVINYPKNEWTPARLTCLKTESFGFTFGRDLNSSTQTIDFGVALGFPASQRSHLVGLEQSSSAWLKEARIAESRVFDSVVLFALDQFCLMGYALPLSAGMRRSLQMG
jgi:hypothetical protein